MNALQKIDDINSHGIEVANDRGAWLQTVTGGRFYPLDPQPAEVDIRDISHALSNIGRFNGHTKSFYSVAQHSCLVHDYMPKRLQKLGLLHDATEAYIGDMIRPLKYYDNFFQEVEEGIHQAIYTRFGLTPSEEDNQMLKHYDNLLCAAEKRDLFPQSEFWSGMPECGLVKTIRAWPPSYAKGQFMRRFNVLFN